MGSGASFARSSSRTGTLAEMLTGAGDRTAAVMERAAFQKPRSLGSIDRPGWHDGPPIPIFLPWQHPGRERVCPACRQPLASLEYQGVEVDHCLECGGTWVDAGELELLTGLSGVEPGSLSRALAGAAAAGTHGRRCPRCRRRLNIIHAGGAPPVELDRCPRGHGLWLDRGEMESVVRSFADGEEGAVARFFANLFRSDLGVDREGS